MTSHDVVDEVRRTLGVRRVGHAGTLDPDATGVLVVGVGRATRFLDYAKNVPKRYLARARFGETTTTQDASGEVVTTAPAAHLSEGDVRSALPEFVGEVNQVPPMVSAVKVGGERLYVAARRGEEVARPARRVTVLRFDLLEFVAGEHPEAVFDIGCSAGTYVRTLIHDLGQRLDCGAHLTRLRRTEAAGFGEADALALADVSEANMRPPIDAVRALPQLAIGEDHAAAVSNGRPLTAPADLPDDALVAVTADGELVAVYRRVGAELLADRVIGGPK